MKRIVNGVTVDDEDNYLEIINKLKEELEITRVKVKKLVKTIAEYEKRWVLDDGK